MQPSTSTLLPSPMLEGFESVSVNTESASARRQRISMACQYCRHRKIRCCGSAPCRNCTRSGRTCEYTPVPEEVNRATREKKALSKAKPAASPVTPTQPNFNYNPLAVPSPMPAYSPYFLDVPTFDLPYTVLAPATLAPPAPKASRPAHLGHRRTSSAPSYESAPWTVPPPAPMLNSPAQLESSAWMYNGWSAALPVPSIETTSPASGSTSYVPSAPFPSVLEQTPLHTAYLSSTHTPAVSSPLVPQHYQMMSTPMPSVPTMSSMPITPPESRSGSVEADYSYLPTSTPAAYLRPPTMNFKGLNIQTTMEPVSYPYTPPISPNTYYTPYSTPSLYSSSSTGSSSTYTPSPPAYRVSPTLAPELSVGKGLKGQEAMVGLGLGLGMGMGLGVPAIEHDVFYTPTMGSEEYFTSY